jgi:hypothetical protein
MYSKASEPNSICAAQSGNAQRHRHLLFNSLNQLLLYDRKNMHYEKMTDLLQCKGDRSRPGGRIIIDLGNYGDTAATVCEIMQEACQD